MEDNKSKDFIDFLEFIKAKGFSEIPNFENFYVNDDLIYLTVRPNWKSSFSKKCENGILISSANMDLSPTEEKRNEIFDSTLAVFKNVLRKTNQEEGFKITVNKEFDLQTISIQETNKLTDFILPEPKWLKEKMEINRVYFVCKNYPVPIPCIVSYGFRDEDHILVYPVLNDMRQRIDLNGLFHYIIVSKEDFGKRFFYDMIEAQEAFIDNLKDRFLQRDTEVKPDTDLPELKPGYHYEQEQKHVYEPHGMIIFGKVYQIICEEFRNDNYVITYDLVEKRLNCATYSSWELLAVIDKMKELNIIAECPGNENIEMTQHKRYRRGSSLL